MLGFVETLDSRGAIRIDEIERIADEAPNTHGVMLRKVHMRGGRSFDTFSHENGGLLVRPIQIIPALADTSIISVDFDEGGATARRTGVIAWALCLDGEVRPVTPGGVCDAVLGATHVELPNGSIEGVTEWSEPSGFADAAAMVAHYVAERAREPASAEQASEEPTDG